MAPNKYITIGGGWANRPNRQFNNTMQRIKD
jgi:hypothetical protein